MVFRDRPVRRAISRIEKPSRKCQRRITLKNAMSNTPQSPAQNEQDSVQTWVKSQWKNPPIPGQISAAINRRASVWRETSVPDAGSSTNNLLIILRSVEHIFMDVLRRGRYTGSRPRSSRHCPKGDRHASPLRVKVSYKRSLG